MRTNHDFFKQIKCQQGVSLVELIVFILVVGIASGALFKVYAYSVTRNADPVIQVRALELAQTRLDEVLALKYDAATPTGGIPACGATGGVACDNTTDANMNDVDDYNNVSDTPYAGYNRTVTVTTANNLKLITVTVVAPKGYSIKLAAYRANF